MPKKRTRTPADVYVSPTALRRAAERRDAGESLTLWDIYVLASTGERLNTRIPKPVERPDPGSHEAKVLQALAKGPKTKGEIEQETDLSRKFVNNAIDRLRDSWGWLVLSDGRGGASRLWLAPVERKRRRAA